LHDWLLAETHDHRPGFYTDCHRLRACQTCGVAQKFTPSGAQATLIAINRRYRHRGGGTRAGILWG